MNTTNEKLVNNPLSDKRNPYTVWFVVLSFIAPVALAYIIFFFVDVSSFSNHGEILNPIIPISSMELKDEKNQLIPDDKLVKKWRLISFVSKDCNAECESRLFDVHQIYASLGKERDRVERMFVHLEPMSQSFLKLVAEKHDGVMHVNGDRSTIVKALDKNIRSDVGFTNNETYIMDPLGNVMMRFTADQPNKDFLSDLRKLLKVSQIG